jgi:O-antigen/teichoic acid export membrane protein
MKYFRNTSWLFGEKILRMVVGLFVGIWVARYLGPEQFGLLSYAQSFVALFTAIATLGLDGIVVRELIKDEGRRDELIGTAFWLKLMGAGAVLVILALAVSFTSNDSFTNLLVFIIASATIFQSFNVIDNILYLLESSIKKSYSDQDIKIMDTKLTHLTEHNHALNSLAEEIGALKKVFNKLRAFYPRIRVYLANTSWIMGEKIATMGVTFFVTIILARYLGPEQFGILAYAMSLVALFGVAGHVGLSGLVVRELVKDTDNKKIILGTSFVLKGIGYLIGFTIVILLALATESVDSIEFWILVIIALSLLFKPFDIIDFWFQSQLQAKYTAISTTLAIIASSVLKLTFVFLSANLIFFAVANLVQTIISVAFLILFFFLKSKINIKEWRFSKEKAVELFKQGWIVFLGSIFAVIYLKIDQVMLKWIVGAEEVGIYAVAASLSEAWYFVPAAIVASFFPKLIKLREENLVRYHHRLQQIFDFLFLLALAVAVVITFFAQTIIMIAFGEAYTDAAPILVVHIWSALFIFMRAAFSKWILIENVLMFSLITTILGALTNVALNYYLIPVYGGIGAAYATIISYTMASYFSLLLHSKTRIIFWMMTKSLFSPLRYTIYLLYLKLGDYQR